MGRYAEVLPIFEEAVRLGQERYAVTPEVIRLELRYFDCLSRVGQNEKAERLALDRYAWLDKQLDEQVGSESDWMGLRVHLAGQLATICERTGRSEEADRWREQLP